VAAQLRDATFDLLGRAIEAGEGRFVAVIAVAEEGRDEEGALGLRAAVVTPGAGGPALVALLELPTVGAWGYVAPGGGVEERSVPPPRILASRLEDWDDDGRLELELVVQYNGPQVCGVGTTAYRHYFVVDAGARPHLSAAILTQIEPEADTLEQQLGTVLHEDTDGDGHRDLVLRSRLCALADIEAPERTCAPPSRTVYRWEPARDAWTSVDPGLSAEPCDERH
jgi:hypothetical protein